MADQHARRLTRSRDHLVGGVAAGIGEYFDIDPTVVRLAFVALALLGQGGAIVAYLVMWIVMPAPGDQADTSRRAARSGGQAVLILLALLLVVMLASGAAWLSAASLHLIWISLRSLPLWIALIVVAWLVLRSRGSRVP